MDRRQFLGTGAGVAAAAAASAATPAFSLEEATLADLRKGLESGRYTARSLVQAYLSRIAALDRRTVNAVLELHPDALKIADALDAERKQKGPRGPLHGIPVLLKDNIDTADRMATTAGSLALEGTFAPRDSAVAARLRAAGAVLLGKTNLSEWANFRSTRSVSGWSGRGGQTRNPYALDRNPSGSSSGSGAAVSANLCALAVGTETDGSVTSPASINGIVGIKPTVGLIGGAGIVPISHTQDTAGPMARTVRDAAILLTALASKQDVDYAKNLQPDALKGARLGVARKFFTMGPKMDALMDGVLDTLKRLGATLVDPADLPTHGQFGDPEFEVLLYEFKADLNAYLAGRGDSVPVKTLDDVIAFNRRQRSREMPWFAQEILERAAAKGPLTEPAYREALAKSRRLSQAEGIDALLRDKKLDAIIAPTSGPAWLIDHVNGDQDTGGCSTPAAVAGYPHITVPAGFILGLPVGLSFFSTAWTEAKLIGYAYAFEQAAQARRVPKLLPTLPLKSSSRP